MKLRTWLLVVAVVITVVACVLVVVSQRTSPEPTEPDEPLATATIPHAATTAPTPTATASGEPMPGDDGGEAVAGCDSYGPGTACDDLEAPEKVTTAQAAGTATAQQFVADYVRFDSHAGGEKAWRSRLARLVAPSAALPLTNLAREDTALAELQTRATLDESRLVQAYADGVDSDGAWLYTVNATVVAKYTDATGTTSNWSVPGTWTVTIDPVTKKVIDVDEDTPSLDDAP